MHFNLHEDAIYKRKPTPEERLMFEVLKRYLLDAYKGAEGKTGDYNYQQAYDDITGRQIMLKHICKFLPFEPHFIANGFKRSIQGGKAA